GPLPSRVIDVSHRNHAGRAKLRSHCQGLQAVAGLASGLASGLAGSLASSLGSAEREQRAVRVAQHDAFDACIQSRLAQNACSDAHTLLEVDDAVADRRLAAKRLR